jgi:hypothetical protein
MPRPAAGEQLELGLDADQDEPVRESAGPSWSSTRSRPTGHVPALRGAARVRIADVDGSAAIDVTQSCTRSRLVVAGRVRKSIDLFDGRNERREVSSIAHGSEVVVDENVRSAQSERQVEG